VGARGPVRKTPTRAADGLDAVLDRIADLVRRVAGEASVSPAAVGIGVPGPIDFRTGSVVHPPNLPGWGVVPLVRLLEERLEVPVAVENDANAVILGEALHGVARDARRVLGFTLGTGVGGGIVIDGRAHHGATGTAAEVGHMVLHRDGELCGCGQRGCLEAYASASAVARRGREAAEAHPESALAAVPADVFTARHVTEAARAGDAVALELFEAIGRDLGQGIANAVNVLDPDVVVLAGGLTKAGDLLLEPVRRAVAEYAFGPAKGVRVAMHRLGDLAGILGAAEAARPLARQSNTDRG
jgi:glucokinase